MQMSLGLNKKEESRWWRFGPKKVNRGITADREVWVRDCLWWSEVSTTPCCRE